MDYYNMQNIISDTHMRTSISGAAKDESPGKGKTKGVDKDGGI